MDFKIHPLCGTFDQTSSQGLGRGERGGGIETGSLAAYAQVGVT